MCDENNSEVIELAERISKLTEEDREMFIKAVYFHVNGAPTEESKEMIAMAREGV
jgi:CO dehydrogenase nickel-insertion accessory protein CooC1